MSDNLELEEYEKQIFPKKKDEKKEKENSFEHYLLTQQKNLFKGNLNQKNTKISLLKTKPFFINNTNYLNTFQNFLPKNKQYLTQTTTLNSFLSKDTKNNLTMNNNTTNFNFRKTQMSLDEKLLLVKENRNALLLKQNQDTIEKFYQKEKRLQTVKDNMLKTKMKLEQKNKKMNYMKRLKLKIFNIINKETKNICEDFEYKNTVFNIKTCDYLKGDHNIKKSILYHSDFRYDKNENAEAHKRSKMIIDIDSIKEDNFDSLELLKKKLSPKEKRTVKEDPTYYFQSNLIINFQQMPLTYRLIKEERNDNMKYGKKRLESFNFENKNNDNYNINNLIDENKKSNSKKKISKKKRIDIKTNLNEIYEKINKTVYDNKTKTLVNCARNIPKELHEKIINKMKDDLRMKGFKTMTQEKNEFLIREKEDVRLKNFLIDNLRKKNNNISNRNIKKNFHINEESLIGQVGQSFNFKNFNKEEVEYINLYKDQIKTNLEEKAN